jgi:hypothetical protein
MQNVRIKGKIKTYGATLWEYNIFLILFINNQPFVGNYVSSETGILSVSVLKRIGRPKKKSGTIRLTAGERL